MQWQIYFYASQINANEKKYPPARLSRKEAEQKLFALYSMNKKSFRRRSYVLQTCLYDLNEKFSVEPLLLLILSHSVSKRLCVLSVRRLFHMPEVGAIEWFFTRTVVSGMLAVQ